MATQITNSFDSKSFQASGLVSGVAAPRPPIVIPSIVAAPEVNAVSTELLQNAVDEANKVLSQTRSDIKLDIDAESKEVVIKIIEPSSGEILNQYPSKASLAIASAIAQSQQQVLDRRMAYQSESPMTGLIIKQKS
jgi:flagellar protein FlaG